MVKADGYGLGALPVARRLHAEGARSFFVARVAEGEALRPALPDAVVYVLDGCPPGTADRLQSARLTPVLNSADQIAEWTAAAAGSPAALHVDTGMNRLGLRADELDRLPGLNGLRVDLVMSHLACADQPEHPLLRRQREAFAAVRARFPDARGSLAASAGVFLGQAFRHDLVRPGISLYGGGPRGRTDPRIRQVATFEAPVLQVREVRAGETVGYGATFTAGRPLTVAVVAAGYADGIIRAGGPTASAWVAGDRRRYLGRISMDLIAVDVTGATVRPGDPVQLLGPEIPVDEAAAWSGTLAYELLTRLAPRAGRVYLGEA